jgi:hypothetical protein
MAEALEHLRHIRVLESQIEGNREVTAAMSQFEAELRQRVSRGDDTYDTFEWYLSAIGAEDLVDRGGPEPDLSWFEREFLKAKSSTTMNKSCDACRSPNCLTAWR